MRASYDVGVDVVGVVVVSVVGDGDVFEKT